MSPAAMDLGEMLLMYDPKHRVSAADAMETPYFKSEEPRPELPTGYVMALSHAAFPLTILLILVLQCLKENGTSWRRKGSENGQDGDEGMKLLRNDVNLLSFANVQIMHLLSWHTKSKTDTNLTLYCC
jgi:hypothetical protein